MTGDRMIKWNRNVKLIHITNGGDERLTKLSFSFANSTFSLSPSVFVFMAAFHVVCVSNGRARLCVALNKSIKRKRKSSKDESNYQHIKMIQSIRKCFVWPIFSSFDCACCVVAFISFSFAEKRIALYKIRRQWLDYILQCIYNVYPNTQCCFGAICPRGKKK